MYQFSLKNIHRKWRRRKSGYIKYYIQGVPRNLRRLKIVFKLSNFYYCFKNHASARRAWTSRFMKTIFKSSVNSPCYRYTFVDGKQQHARQIRIIGRLGIWWGMSIIPGQFFPDRPHVYTHNRVTPSQKFDNKIFIS